MGAAESAESEQQLKPFSAQSSANGLDNSTMTNTTLAATVTSQPTVQLPAVVKPVSENPASMPSATSVAIRPSNGTASSATANINGNAPVLTASSAPKAPLQSQLQSQPAVVAQSLQPSAAAHVSRGSASVQTHSVAEGPSNSPNSRHDVNPTTAANPSQQQPQTSAHLPRTSGSSIPSAPSAQPPSAISTLAVSASAALPGVQPNGKPAASSTPSVPAASSQSVPLKSSQPVQSNQPAGAAPPALPQRQSTASTSTSSIVSTAAKPASGSVNSTAGASNSSSIASGAFDSSSEKVLVDAEVAAMEEFILKEAKSQSAVYEHPLWYELVEWASKFMSSDIVLAYEHHIIAYQILSISKLDKFRKKLDEYWLQRKAKKKQIAHINQQLKSSTLPDDQRGKLTSQLIELQSSPVPSQHGYEIPYEFARQLLELDKQLAVVRHDFVPGRISEEQFWYLFFDTLISSVQAHVISTQHKVKQQHINMQFFKPPK